MSPLEVALNFALLVAGWYGRDLVKVVRNRGSKGLVARRRSKFETGRSAAIKWAIAYYRESGSDERLFELPDGRMLCYLTKSAWQTPRIDIESVEFTCGSARGPDPVSQRAIRARRRLGQRVWDGEVFLLSRLGESAGGLTVEARQGSYFQYLTTATRLTSEAIRCAGKPGREPKWRGQVAAGGDQLRNGSPGGQLIGFGVAMIVATDHGWQIFIQQRSHEAGVAGGSSAVVPAYVCEPVLDGLGESLDPYRDLLRELSEELYADQHRELADALRKDWFYELAPIQRLIELRKRELFIFDIVGCGFDPLTAELHFAAVAVVTDPGFAEHELRRMTKNWEALGIRLVGFESDELSDLILSENTYPTSAFVLACARRWFAQARVAGRI